MKVLFAGLALSGVALWAQPRPDFDINTEGVWTESVALDGQSRHVALGRLDGGVLLLDAASGNMIGRWEASGNNQVEQLTFSADGRRLLAVSPNRVVRLLAADDPPRVVSNWTIAEFYPGGGLTPDGQHVVIVAHDAPLRWCESDSGHVVREWRDAQQPHGYTAACVLDNAGLTVVSHFDGYAAIVDASSGEVLGRFQSRGSNLSGERFHPTEGMVARRLGDGFVWPSDRLLSARTTKPSVPLIGEWGSVGGGVGRAATISLPNNHRFFWRPDFATPVDGWVEPKWDLLRNASEQGPVILDPVHKRLWVQLPKGHWQVWGWGTLGTPDEFVVGSYGFAPRALSSDLIWIGAVNGRPVVFDRRERLPRYLPAAAPAPAVSDSMAPQNVTIGVEADGSVGYWIATPDQKIGGWALAFRNDQNAEIGARIATGFSGRNPGVRVSSSGLLAVYSEGPAVDTATAPEGVRRVLPAIQIWDAKTRTRLPGFFNDHRQVGVADVRWSVNGEWIATTEATGGSGSSRIRVFSAREGRRLGSAEDYVGQFVDFAVGPNGELAWSDANGVVRWRQKGADKVRLLTEPNSDLALARLAIGPNADRIACLTKGNDVVVLETASGKEINRINLARPQELPDTSPSGGLMFVSQHELLVVTSGVTRIRVVSL